MFTILLLKPRETKRRKKLNNSNRCC